MKWKVGVYPYIFHISLFVFLIATYMLGNLILNIATLEEVDWRARATWQGDVAGRRRQGDVAGRRGNWKGKRLEGDATKIGMRLAH